MTQSRKPRPFAASDRRRQFAPARQVDIRHLELELDIDERKRHVAGVATLTWTAINDGLADVTLDLASCMHVRAVRDGKRALAWEHHNDKLEVTLPRPAAMGQAMQLSVEYEGTPARGLWFTAPDAHHPQRPVTVWSQGQDEDSRYWFPCWDSPNDKFTSETRVTARQPFTVIANGRLVAVHEDKRRRRRTFHWREDFPHPAYLLSLVVGEFVCQRQTVDGVELQYYVHPDDAKTIPWLFGRTPDMLRFFQSVTDYPYPYEKYSQTLVPEFLFGGMENISATTLTDSIRLDAVSQQESFTDWLVAHELAHQWWGNLLTCKEWSHAWLNEGFATYFEALFTEHHVGREIFQWQMQTQADDYFSEDAGAYRRPVVERRWRKPIEIFDSHLYEKGSLVLHMLRFELGDELFWKAIRHYVRRYQFQSVETNDLKNAIEEATGRNLDLFFEQWILAPGFPALQVGWEWKSGEGNSGGGVALQVRQTHDRSDGTPLFDFPLEVELGWSKRSERLRLRVSLADETFHLPAPKRPLYVRVDPDHHILKKMQYAQGRGELLAQLQHASDFHGQSDAATGLERFRGDEDVVQALTRALRRARLFPTRRALYAALGRVGGERARDVLLRALTEKDPRSRRGCVRALGGFRDDARVVTALDRLWGREKSYIVRAQILNTLVKLRASIAARRCREALKIDSYRDMIRVAALQGLARLEDADGIELALSCSGKEASRWTREAAFLALADLGRVYPERRRRIQDALEDALEDDFFSQLAATKALGRLGQASAIAALRRTSDSDTDGRIRKVATAAIERISGEESPEAWKAIRAEVEELRRDNQDLRARLERIEGSLRAPNGTAGKRPTRRTSR